MTLELRKVTRETLKDVIKLSVHKEQRDFVAANSVTVAQAGFEPGCTVFGLWDGNTAVGLMAVIDMPEYPWPEKGDDLECLYLWRMMIDKDQQGKGYGKAALKLLVELARDLNRPRVASSVVQHKDAAMRFYEGFGFRQTGAVSDEELVISLAV